MDIDLIPIIAISFLVIGFILGGKASSSIIEDDCTKIHATVIRGTVYICEEKAVEVKK